MACHRAAGFDVPITAVSQSHKEEAFRAVSCHLVLLPHIGAVELLVLRILAKRGFPLRPRRRPAGQGRPQNTESSALRRVAELVAVSLIDLLGLLGMCW